LRSRSESARHAGAALDSMHASRVQVCSQGYGEDTVNAGTVQTCVGYSGGGWLLRGPHVAQGSARPASWRMQRADIECIYRHLPARFGMYLRTAEKLRSEPELLWADRVGIAQPWPLSLGPHRHTIGPTASPHVGMSEQHIYLPGYDADSLTCRLSRRVSHPRSRPAAAHAWQPAVVPSQQ